MHHNFGGEGVVVSCDDTTFQTRALFRQEARTRGHRNNVVVLVEWDVGGMLRKVGKTLGRLGARLETLFVGRADFKDCSSGR